MATLYQDYRPQNFSEVLGQEHIKITLQNEIKTNKIAHAFLFCGPRAVGKTTLARIFAKAVNCSARADNEYEPCGTCDNCLSIKAGNHLDVVEIDAASNTGVDNVRDNIISYSRLAPSNAKYKVFIIDEVHMLSTFAFNALLKIIEEPPAHVIFILCTTEVHKVPATIISRCERFDFKRINLKEIVQKLKRISQAEGVNIDEDVLEAIARQSGGHLRDAESLLGQVFALGEKNISSKEAELIIPHYNNNEIINLLEFLESKQSGEAIALINNLVDSGVNIRNFNLELISTLRKMLIFKVNPKLSLSLGLNLGDSLELALSKINDKLSLEDLSRYLNRFLISYNDKKQFIPQLPLELAIIDLGLGKNETIQTRISPSLSQVEKPKKVADPAKPKPEIAKEAPKEASKELVKEDKVNKVKLNPNLSFKDLMDKWPEFLVKIKKYNHSLSFVLQNCQPKNLKENCLELIFKYKFHQDRINDQAIKGIIEKALIEVFSSKIGIKAILDENLDLKTINSSLETSSQPPSSTNESEEGAAEQAHDFSENVAEKELDKNEKSANISSLLNIFGGEFIN